MILLGLASTFLMVISAQALDNSMTYHSYGDSITAGAGVANQDRYATLLAYDFGLAHANFAVSGQTSCQMADTQVFKPQSIEFPALQTVMIGTNDSNIEGLGAYEAVYLRCLKASLTWLAMPVENKVLATSCEAEGEWTSVPGMPTALQSTQFGSRLTCNFKTDNAPAYFWFAAGDDLNSAFLFQANDKSPLLVKTKSPVKIKTRDGRGLRGQVAFRYSGLPSGSQKFTFTVQSKTSSPVIIYGVGSLKGHQPSRLFVGGIPFQLNNQKAEASAKYNSTVKNLVSELRTEGFGLQFVDVRKHIGSSSQHMGDGLHPNKEGNLRLRDAFFETITALE